MTTNEISERLRTLDVLHREVGDGGYALLGEVLEYYRTLDTHNRNLLRSELLRLVAAQDSTLWGVALEALVQAWQSAISSDLASMLADEHHTGEWEGHVLLALLRLGYRPIAEKAASHIVRQLAMGDDTVLPLLAALSRVDTDKCLYIAARFFVAQFNSGQRSELAGYIPAFVSHFLDVDTMLPARFVERLTAADNEAGRKMAELVREYIGRPYVRKRLGEELARSLENSISSACSAQ